MAPETTLDDLLRRWEELRERGESPTPEELCCDAPELLESLRCALADLLAADRAVKTKPLMGHPAARSAGVGTGAGGGTEVHLQTGAEPVPGYRLVAPLGRGGFGEVWRAEGPGGFPLAFKFVRLDGPVGAVELRSLEVLKHIRHPNLLSTVGAWEISPHLIIAMELADRTLRDRLREARTQGRTGIPGPELREYLREAAKGIDFLNEPRHSVSGRTGVRLQHRDIKPANILLVGTGVKVADFGLVRLLEQTHASHTGSLTPAYAAPEFFAGRTSPHSDQYSLAVTYCELRGGRLPFVGSAAQLMHGHVNAPPDVSMLPEAERPVVARALAKRPDDRWPDCRTFVEALVRAQAAESAPATTQARAAAETRPPVPPDIEARPRGRRRSLLAIGLVSAMAALALVLLSTPSFVLLPKIQPGPIEKGQPPGGPPPHLPSASGAAPAVPIPAGVSTDVREAKPVRFAGHRGAVWCVAWHPISELALSGGDDGTVRLWNPRTGEPSQTLDGHRGPVKGLAVSPDGRYLLTGGKDRTVRSWDLQSGRELWNRATHESAVHAVAISPDGRWGLSTGEDSTIRLWGLQGGRETKVFHTGVEYWSVAFTADSLHILAAGDSPVVVRLRVDTGTEVGRFSAHRDVVWSVACASKGEWAISGGGEEEENRDYRVQVWRATDGWPWRTFEGHTAAVGCLAIAPDGRRAISGSADCTVRLWDCKAGQELRCFRAHRANVTSVAFAPDGTHAVSGGLDGVAYVWEMP